MNYAEVFDTNRGTWDFMHYPIGLAVALFVAGLIFAGVASLLK